MLATKLKRTLLLKESHMKFYNPQNRWMAQRKLKRMDLFYDVASPYSWYAFEVLQRYKNIWSIDLHLMPVLLGAIFKESGNTSVSSAKIRNSRDDVKRCAKYYEVPLKTVKDMKELVSKGTLIPMRVLTSVDLYHHDYIEEASRAFWRLRWNMDLDITSIENISKMMEMSGLSEVVKMDQLMEWSKKEVIKNKLKENTKLAVKYGAFGVPTMVLHEDERKLFFGVDRLPIVALELNEPWMGPNPRNKINSYMDINDIN